MTTDAALLKSIEDAIARASTQLLSLQSADGSWNAFEDDEPLATANQMVLDAFLGRLMARDQAEGARFLASKQNADGSFAGYPHAAAGSLSATAQCLAALHAAGPAHAGDALQRAQQWLDAHGGVNAVMQLMFTASDQSAVYLAMVGLADPNALPDPELWFSLVPPVVSFVQLRLNAGVIMGAFAMGWVTRKLRQNRRGGVDWLWGVHKAEALACARYINRFQNPDGNWDGNTIQSGLYVAGLFAAGADVTRGTAWLDAQKIYDAQGMHMRVFTCENWMTAFTLRALLHGGVARTDPRIERALRFLASSQNTTPMPEVDQRKKSAARSGGWSFQPSNPTMPDSDDTGSVLSALGLALERVEPPLTDALTDVVQKAVDRAMPQLLDMQSPNGGWSAFVWNLGDKPPGPMFTKPTPLPRTLLQKAAFFLSPPVELKDPPVEGLTGRVLSGLGAVGYRAGAPAVESAATWLQAQRAANGVWWGRWLVNYLCGTASVVSGLAACRYDMTTPWLAHAIDWLIEKQNDDGGWGETPASYTDPAQAGRGPSMPPVTGIVLVALMDAGRFEDPSVLRGIHYLLSAQQSDGLWPNNAWLQVMMPPDQFYEYDGERMCRPIEALGVYRAKVRERDNPSPKNRLAPLTRPGPITISSSRKSGTWALSELRACRAFADPVADAVITSIFSRGEAKAVSDVMVTLVRSDEALPTALPDDAKAYFRNTEAMPAWADLAKLKVAQDIFANSGWAVALGLFTSSLPQAYCAADGARVLLQTQGMTRNVRRRILETAQFVFDVLAADGFGAEGRAIRAVQKVRLMHATIRHLTLLGGEWDSKAWGVPINQEDLAGTLMTFSVVILDTFVAVDIKLTDAQQAAYLHLWQVVGHFLGMNPALVPTDVADGRALMDAIRADQWRASVEGAQLGEALTGAMDDYLPLDMLKDLPSALVRRVAGNRCADLLGLPPSDWTALLLTASADIEKIIEHAVNRELPGDTLLRHLTTEMMEALIDVQRDGKQAGFRIPLELIRSWSLTD